MDPSTTWIDVASDAVKIGLGALIGGLFALLGTWATHRTTINKLKFERRTKMLTDVSTAVESLMVANADYYASVKALARQQQSKATPLSEPVLNELTKQAEKAQSHLYERVKEVCAVQSNLMLLGEHDCREKFDKFVVAVRDSSNNVHLDVGKANCVDDAKSEEEVRQNREQFHKSMRDAFDKE